MRSYRFLLLGAVLAAAVAVPAGAQEDTARGVRIGLRYDPGMKPGMLVLPIAGAHGDSIRAILQRDLEYSDRFSVINLSATDAALLEGRAPSGAAASLNYDLFARLGAAGVIRVTATAAGLHVAMYDVARKQVGSVDDFPVASAPLGRDWRHAIHGISDAIEEWITGQRGIAQSRIAFVRGNVVRIIDSDGAEEFSLPAAGEAMSPSWHPNGHLIAYNTFGLESRIVVHDLRTARSRALGAQRNATHITPIFTPDGRSLAYSLSTEQGADLYVMPLGGDAFPGASRSGAARSTRSRHSVRTATVWRSCPTGRDIRRCILWTRTEPTPTSSRRSILATRITARARTGRPMADR